jgi:quercetin dioxygenase-like cupin family protein
MARIEVRDVKDAEWVAKEKGILFNVHSVGSPDVPELMEIRLRPNETTVVHSHEEHEIMYVVTGELRFGSKVLGPGSSVFIPGGAFYTFSAGPEGLQFLNFRPRQDLTYTPLKGASLAEPEPEIPPA